MIYARLSLSLLLAFPGLAAAMTLSEALERSAQADPAVLVSLALSRAEREASQEDRGSLLPQVAASAGAEYAYTKADGVFGASEDHYPLWSAGVQLRQPLFRLDWRARLERAEALDAQAEIRLDERRLQLMIRVAQRYFDVLLAREDLRQTEAELAAARRAAQDTQRRFEAELAPGLDVKDAQARLDLAQARRLAARVRLETAQDALDEVTGNGRADLPSLAEDTRFPPLTPAAVEPWLSATREGNPQLRSARQAAVIARNDRRSTLAQGMPSLDLVATAGRQDTSRFVFGQRADDARVGVELTVPIYSGGIASARLRAAEARAEAAEADAERLEKELLREARSRHRELLAAYAEAAALDRARVSAEAAVAAARAGYEAGTRTVNELLDTEARLAEARRNFNVVRYRLLLTLLELKQLTGALSADDFAGIDRLLTVTN